MTFADVLIVLLIGGAVGLLPGLFGVGGSFLAVPALSGLAGIPVEVAIGSAACQVLGPATTGMLHRHEAGVLRWQLPLTMLGGLATGVWLGMRFLDWAKGAAGDLDTWLIQGRQVPRLEVIMLSCYVGLLSILALVVTVEWHLSRRLQPGQRRGWLAGWRLPPLGTFSELDGQSFSLPVVTTLGIVTGFLTGGMGMGGGILMMPALVALVGVPTQKAINATLVVTWLSSVGATLGHALARHIDLTLVCLLLAGGTIGAKVGSRLGERLGGRRLRGYFALLILAVAVWLGWRLAALLGLVGSR
jgi:uncharacterized membrane protein YfcA